MIIRARPKYLKYHFFNLLNTSPMNLEVKNELFFNSGRAGLKFLLKKYSKYQKKRLLIAMQSFNCEVVMDAALQSQCQIILLDIKLEDFSVDLKDLKCLMKKPDVLLLTHFQGIPNLQYREIASYCKNNDILLIDDIAQTEESYFGQVKVGSLSDFSLRSFRFDKPFSSFEGGSLAIGNLKDENLKMLLIDAYQKLKFESKHKSFNDLKILKFLFRYSEKETCNSGLNNYPLLRFLINLSLTDSLINKLIRTKILVFVSRNINTLFRKFGVNKNIIVLKLRNEKINLIMWQRLNYKFDNSEVLALERFLTRCGVEISKFNNATINWNRYSLLDNRAIKNRLLKEGVEADNYNWPNPLHILYANNKNVIFIDNYRNSDYSARHIINIPIWSDFFRKKQSL